MTLPCGGSSRTCTERPTWCCYPGSSSNGRRRRARPRRSRSCSSRPCGAEGANVALGSGRCVTRCAGSKLSVNGVVAGSHSSLHAKCAALKPNPAVILQGTDRPRRQGPAQSWAWTYKETSCPHAKGMSNTQTWRHSVWPFHFQSEVADRCSNL